MTPGIYFVLRGGIANGLSSTSADSTVLSMRGVVLRSISATTSGFYACGLFIAPLLPVRRRFPLKRAQNRALDDGRHRQCVALQLRMISTPVLALYSSGCPRNPPYEA